MSQYIESLSVVGRYPERRRRRLIPRKVWLQYALLLAFYGTFFTFWQLEPVPWNVHASSILLMAVCLYPIMSWRAKGSHGPPMFELICLAYALQFAIPVYLQPNELMIQDKLVLISWSDVQKSQLLTTLGVCALVIAYTITARSRFSMMCPKLDLPLDPRKRNMFLKFAVSVGVGLAFMQAIGRAPDNSGPLGAIVRVLTNQLNLAIILLAYEIYRERHRNKRTMLMLYGLTAVAFLLGLSSGMLEGALIPLALLFIVRWDSTRKLAWRYLIIAAALFLLLNPIKIQYRAQAWFGDENMSLPARIGLWVDLAKDNLTGELEQPGTGGPAGFVQRATSRFDLLHRFAYIGQMTPEVVPFYEGETYAYLVYGWIPRIIWPNKPEASDASRQMDLDYGFLYDVPGQSASIGIGQLPEAWVNFGAPGILIVMILQGIFFALLRGMLTGPRSEGGQAIYLSIMVSFLNGIGSVAVVFFTSLFQNTFANALVLRPFAKSFKARRTDTPGRRVFPS